MHSQQVPLLLHLEAFLATFSLQLIMMFIISPLGECIQFRLTQLARATYDGIIKLICD